MPAKNPPQRVAGPPLCDYCKKPCKSGIVRTADGVFCSPKHRTAAAALRRAAAPPERVDVAAVIETAIAKREYAAITVLPAYTSTQKLILQSWLEGKSPDTRNSYQSSARHFARWLVARELVDDAGDPIATIVAAMRRSKSDVAALVIGWISDQLSDGSKRGSIATRCSGVKKLLEKLEAASLIPFVPNFERPRAGERSAVDRMARYEGIPEAFDRVAMGLYGLCECEKLEPTDLRDLTLVLVMGAMGLRRLEVVRLQVADLDLDKKAAVILGKGRHQTENVRVPPVLAPVLRRWVQMRSRIAPPGPLFTGSELSAAVAEGADPSMRRGTLNRILKRRADQFGVQITPHDLRRIFCTEAIKQLGIYKALAITRHANVGTLGIYDLTQGQEAAEGADSVGAAILRRGKRRT